MTYHPDDRPDPSEQPIRARVPEHVAGGCFSTGVIVMTAQTEFILDFVQNLGRPHQIVARVVMPHSVLPQLVDALGRNIQLYRGRWGELPQPRMVAGSTQQIVSPGHPIAPTPPVTQAPPPPASPQQPLQLPGSTGPSLQSGNPLDSTSSPPPADQPGPTENVVPGPPDWPVQPTAPSGTVNPGDAAQSHRADSPGGPTGDAAPSQVPPVQQAGPAGQGNSVRQTTAQDIYDDLKIRDELLSGVYANAVMIGHGPHEFSFDFITNFYPHSAVSARVFLAAGQIPRLYDSLRGTWDQLRLRMQPPPPPLQPPPSA
jgi:hypothetical protein